MKKSLLSAVILCVVAGVVVAATHLRAASSGSSTTEVKIDNFSFNPPALKVKTGTTIHWTNRDDMPHNVVAEDKTFRSKVMDTDEQFSFTFDKPGTYSYFCGLHPRMRATITVE